MTFLVRLLLTLAPALYGAEHDWTELRQLRSGQRIHVVQKNMKAVDGEFVGVSDDALRVRSGGAEASVARPDVVRVTVAAPSKRAVRALLWGAVGAGGAAALAIGALSAGGGSDAAQEIVAGSALIGAGIGAVTGAALPAGSTVYRAAKP